MHRFLAVAQTPRSHFWPREVLQDRDVRFQLARYGANGLDRLAVLSNLSMRKIQAEDICTGERERADDLGISRRRSDGRNNLRSLLNFFHKGSSAGVGALVSNLAAFLYRP